LSVFIHNIECLVPKTRYSQRFIMNKVKRLLASVQRGEAGPNVFPKTSRYIDSIYKGSDIAQRYSCIATPDDFFRISKSGKVIIPTTKVRNDLFTKSAREMFVNIARNTIENCPGADFNDITHLVTVSCTGFFNPGPDYYIIDGLKLNNSVKRYNIGFMGCHAAFPALRLARDICLAEPDATVLVVSVELCSLHLQLKDDLDSLLGGALFADGGAAAIVSAKKPSPRQKGFELKTFESTLIPDSRDEMAWTISDTGFEMILSQYVPKIIKSNIREILETILEKYTLSIYEIDHWAIHPGGKAILDRIEESLDIQNRCGASRKVLKQFGNMSSATILFVLKEILKRPCAKGSESVFAMAFGPGLTVETALLEKLAPQKK
jgi:predicted naringenin-chalcone synthase